MMQKKIQTFNDGLLDIYTIGDDDSIKSVISGIRFQNRTVGSKRFFEAYEFQRRADKVVRIPRISEPDANGVVLIDGKQYNILQVQGISDTAPPCWQLTLEAIKEGRYHVID